MKKTNKSLIIFLSIITVILGPTSEVNAFPWVIAGIGTLAGVIGIAVIVGKKQHTTHTSIGAVSSSEDSKEMRKFREVTGYKHVKGVEEKNWDGFIQRGLVRCGQPYMQSGKVYADFESGRQYISSEEIGGTEEKSDVRLGNYYDNRF